MTITDSNILIKYRNTNLVQRTYQVYSTLIWPLSIHPDSVQSSGKCSAGMDDCMPVQTNPPFQQHPNNIMNKHHT